MYFNDTVTVNGLDFDVEYTIDYEEGGARGEELQRAVIESFDYIGRADGEDDTEEDLIEASRVQAFQIHEQLEY
jgi:hypothetical protein